jgi:hypothetical protein
LYRTFASGQAKKKPSTANRHTLDSSIGLNSRDPCERRLDAGADKRHSKRTLTPVLRSKAGRP